MARNQEQKIILTSWFHGPAEIHEAYTAGAVAFLSKDIEVSHLAEAIRRVHTGARLLQLEEPQGEVATKGGRSQQQWDRLVTLTPRELEILSCLARLGRLEEAAEHLSIKPGTARIHVNQHPHEDPGAVPGGSGSAGPSIRTDPTVSARKAKSSYLACDPYSGALLDLGRPWEAA